MNHFDYRNGVLHAEAVDLIALADAVGTPFYCYSTATLERHYRVFADAFGDVDSLVCYAMKANSNQSVLRTLAVGLRGLTEGSVGLTIHTANGLARMRFESKAAYLWVALGLLILVMAVTFLQARSRFGYLLRAMGEDEEVAGTLGVNTLPLKLGSLGLSAALTGMLGTFYAQYLTFIDPDSAFNIFDSIQMALIAIIGGVGTIFGPLLGALLMVPLGVWLRGLLGAQTAGLHLVIYAVILIIAALFMPRGVMGVLQARGGKLRARKAVLAPDPGTE